MNYNNSILLTAPFSLSFFRKLNNLIRLSFIEEERQISFLLQKKTSDVDGGFASVVWLTKNLDKQTQQEKLSCDFFIIDLYYCGGSSSFPTAFFS